MANAYQNRIRGEKAENLELAIAACEAALKVCIRGKKAENLELAIAAYEASLEVWTRDAFPFEWAACQNNLASAYFYRIRREKAENLELAIAACEASLEVWTRDAFPFEWAACQNNLASAYQNRIRREKAENLKLAIAAFEASLEIRTRDAFPIENANTLYRLGVAYQKNSQLPEAYNTFNSAIETVELMRSEIIIGGEADRQKLAEEWNKLYQSMIEVCLAMKNNTAALEYVERSKTRNLVELFHKARSLPSQVQRISFAEIRSLLAENEAILEWYITYNGFKVFIVTRDSPQPDIWQSSSQDLQALQELQQEYLDDIEDEEKYDNWKNQLDSRLERLAQILHIDEIISRLPENCQKLILVPFRYLHLFPLHALTSSRQKADKTVETGCLLELFPGGVRYTPSCQLLQLSQRENLTAEDTSPSKFFAIQNPTEDLDFTDIEVEAIAKSFNPAEVLIREKASKAGLQQQIASLQNADIAHFSCHGFFDFLNPEKSSLILAGAKIATDGVPSEEKRYIRSRRGETYDIAECLTLTEIFDLQLSKCRLVVLSACETGLTDARNSTDEYIGLPSGFFYAGVTSILSTLWAVNDVSTAILTIKFYELLRGENRPPVAIALRESQLWLRDATVQDLVGWVAGSKLISDERKDGMQDYIAWGEEPENTPYQSPHFWAAFCAVGQ
ncbi:CHAT domain-containing protein [Microcoleus sp. PH2017_30_WIL_O_A]|uniref:CHAT domain-containing protein n=1 Tax=Microcoleus sp. PH2017_30_WIL_O_A TaxID=2798840 RepID=UPI0025CF073A|nr:CHAT domain-containing protein [Microcoleus sp. PH2017_30_WIL_O_A]